MIPSTNEGALVTLTPVDQGPSRGAKSGRSCTPTAIINVKTDPTMAATPIHPTILILSRVRREAKRMVRMQATTTKTTVQVAWRLMAFNEIDTLRRAEPAIPMRKS